MHATAPANMLYFTKNDPHNLPAERNPTNYQTTSALSAPPSRTKPFRWTLYPRHTLRRSFYRHTAIFRLTPPHFVV
jgi:hypothetical protein